MLALGHMRLGIRALPLVLLAWVLMTGSAHAVLGTGNPMCMPWNAACPCNAGINPPKCNTGGPNKANCPPGICIDETAGFTTKGICPAAGVCKGVSTSDGKSLGDLKGIMDLAKGLMDMLKPKEGGGGGAGGSPNPLSDLYPPCVTNPATGTVSPIPCKNSDGSINYGGNGTGLFGGTDLNTNVSDSLLDALGKTSDIIDETPGETDDTGTDKSTADDSKTGDDKASKDGDTKSPIVPEDATQLKSGSKGDILIGEGGITIVGSTRDGDSETASFFGSDSRSRLTSQSLIGRLCAARPWDGSFLKAVIPSSFFDGLCRMGGYQVGVAQLAPSTGGAPRPKTFTAPTDMPAYVPPPDTGAPSVEIWAEPDRVRLGTRTYIFWSSQNVESCKVSGPSFQHTTLSGGASTVTITDTTVYTIACKGLDGSEATDSVTVYLSI